MQLIQENDTHILILEGDIQGSQVQELAETLKTLLEKKARRVALDMTNVGYVYSRGIGVLVRAQKSLQNHGGELYLYNLNHGIQKILMEVNLMDYLNGFGTKEEMEFEFYRPEETSKDETSLELGLFVETVEKGETNISFKLTGTIDSESDLETLKSECQSALSDGRTSIKLIMTDLIYIDDRGVYELKVLRDSLVEKSGSLTLVSVNEIISDQLKIMGMTDQFIIEN